MDATHTSPVLGNRGFLVLSSANVQVVMTALMVVIHLCKCLHQTVKVLKAGNTLANIGNVMASKAKVVQEATCFMAACYGEKNKPSTMTALCQRVWKDKTGRANIVSAP